MSALEELREALSAAGYGERLLVAEPLARHTSFGIGGPADLFLAAHKVDDLVAVASLARARGVPFLVLGGGSNILVADRGVRGLVIVNACVDFTLDAQGGLRAEAGVPLTKLVQVTASQGWAGLEWAAGIPGTLGGALVGNAGAYGGCMADVVRGVRLLRPDGASAEVKATALQYGYRTSALKQGGEHRQRPIVLDATLELARGDLAELRQKIETVAVQRAARIPEGRSAGSVFKRTLQYPAGFLIEQAGLKGRRLGGAEISPKHANFILNTGGATASDVRALIELVQCEVLAAFGQHLEPEIEYIGDWS